MANHDKDTVVEYKRGHRSIPILRSFRSKFSLRLAAAAFVSTTKAQNTNLSKCITEADTFVGNSQAAFSIGTWMQRGICVRQHNIDSRCYESLAEVLGNLNELRAAEYNGSAGVLALLPTIGALLGAPTNEIWRLLTIVPFGGMLAMTLSFGGAILPIRVEDYELSMNQELRLGSSFHLRQTGVALKEWQTNTSALTRALLDKIDERLYREDRVKVIRSDVWFGLLGMSLLWVGAQAAMIIIEQGAVLPWWW